MADQPHSGAGAGFLFSTDAVDNAEVVPEDPPLVRESMWSTAANPDADDEPVGDSVDYVDTPAGDSSSRAWDVVEEPWGPPPTRSDVGPMWDDGVFSPEPVEYEDDVIDAADHTADSWHDDTVIRTAAGGGPLFSSGSGAAAASTATDPWHYDAGDAPGAPSHAGASHNSSARSATPFEPGVAAETDSGPDAGAGGARTTTAGEQAVDLNGLAAAASLLAPGEADRVAVPLMMAAALLGPGERVERVVSGTMLGRNTAVVLTTSRLLVINDRRWDPAIDIYALNGELMVRGRRDDHVAAMTFADDVQMSMVDDIVDADAAVELAEHLRSRTTH